MSLGSKIILLRKERGISQGQLAEKLNIHQSMVTRWKKDKVLPRKDTLEKLAQIFEVHVEELVDANKNGTSSRPQLNDPKLMELLSQLHRLSDKDREALKSVIEAMLTRSKVQEAIGA